MKAPHGWPAIAAWYGWDTFAKQHLRPTMNAAERAAVVKALWEPRMVLVRAPKGFSFYFDRDADGMADPDELMRGIRVHPKAAASLEGALREVSDAGLWEFVESCAGGYAYRTQRGSLELLSMHALGAVDFDALKNARGKPPELTRLGSEPGLGVVRIFRRRGWTWGGLFGTPDAMHFQLGSGY